MPTALGHVLAQAGVDRALRAGRQVLPNWYIERRAIAVPTRMFSLVASSMKPSDAITGSCVRPLLCGVTTPSAPPKRVGMAVREDQCRDRLVAPVLARKGHPAAELLREVRASTTIQPVLPSISVDVRDVEAAQLVHTVAHLVQADALFSVAWRHRLG